MPRRKFMRTNNETYDKKGRIISSTRNSIKFKFEDGIYVKESDDIVTYNYYYNQRGAFYTSNKSMVVIPDNLFTMEYVRKDNGVSTTYEYSSFCDEEMTQLVKNSLCTISENGNNGFINVINEYDDKGHIIRSVSASKDYVDVSETTFDENGSKTISYTSWGKTKLFKNTREYNLNGDIIREYHHDDFNNPILVSSYEYYEGTNIMKSSKAIFEDEPNKIFLSYYDRNGDILYSYKADRFCNGSSSLEVLESRVYDINGRIVKSYSSEYGWLLYNYESDKTTITSIDDTDYGTPKTTVTTIYLNEDGDPIRSEKVENGKTISVTTYHYNNIIRYNDMEFVVRITTEETYNEDTKEVYAFVKGRTNDNNFEISRGCCFVEYKHDDGKIYFDKRFVSTTLTEYYEDKTTLKTLSEISETEY
jgi:hypothetical protein